MKLGVIERHLVGPLRRAFRATRVPIWYHRDYRLPSATTEGRTGMEPRRADHVLTALRAARVVGTRDVRVPLAVSIAEILRVHSARYVMSLHEPMTLGRIFATDAPDLVVDEILGTVRLACGGTLAAAREALARSGPALNLLGGFHHAGPQIGGGLCALNDVAIALAALRADGFDGQVVVIDLDAHPPDGLAQCLEHDRRAFIGTISGARWGPLAGAVDETVLPPGTGDAAYLAAVDGLLGRMPPPVLAFVIAGGDVLAGDRLGTLGLSLDGARQRDIRVAAALRGVPSVWLPGGGYHEDAWKILAGVGLVLGGRAAEPVLAADPLSMRFVRVAGGLDAERLQGDDVDSLALGVDDLMADLERRPREARLLGYYSAGGIEYAFTQYGLAAHVERLGYRDLRAVVDRASVGDRARVFGNDGTREQLLMELIVERRTMSGREVVFVHWLNLRHPRGATTRVLLPGQDVPGLGVALDVAELLERMAARLGLAGLAFRPAHYHLAYAARRRFRFLDAARQGRFEALLRDLAMLPLPQASIAVAQGQVSLDGKPYTWEPDDMVDLLAVCAGDAPQIAAAREAARFTIAALPRQQHRP